MKNTLQAYLPEALKDAANELIAAYESLPEDKRETSPGGKARTPKALVAECAFMNLNMHMLLESKQWPDFFNTEYVSENEKLQALSWEELKAKLLEGAENVGKAIAAVPAEDVDTVIQYPWTTYTLADTMMYPYWNMMYHQGQIIYLSTMLETAE
ncbi:MAG TPA: DinB family protein [Verrucomicrobiae bacterium]|nr:DinB family protein [Verrucomicrobiae bacterium]